MANKIHVKKGDTVYVLAGKDAGSKGKILHVYPSKQQVIVEGVNVSKKHKKPRSRTQQGGIIEQESPIHVSNVMLVCSRCGVPTKIAKEITGNGQKVRKCKKCNEVVDIAREAKEDKE